MSLLDSPILGRLADFEDGDQDQSELNADSLFVYDQRTLLDEIKNLNISKYDIEFLLDSVNDSPKEFWVLCLKELIHVYSLDTLKYFIQDEFTNEKVDETKQLLRFLKCEFPYILRDEVIPVNRDDVLSFMKSHSSPNYMNFSILTMAKDSFERFKQVCSHIVV